jgi:hypothetical protein
MERAGIGNKNKWRLIRIQWDEKEKIGETMGNISVPLSVHNLVGYLGHHKVFLDVYVLRSRCDLSNIYESKLN